VASRDRRTFLSNASALSAGVIFPARRFALADPSAETVRDAVGPPPEVSRIRLVRTPAICLAPAYLSQELLRLEGFRDVEYTEVITTSATALTGGRADVAMVPVQEAIPQIDAGQAIVLLAGVHAGCYELFGTERIRAIRDLRGKTVAITALGSADHIFIASMLAYVGMNPAKDVNWVATGSVPDTMRFFVEGKADAFLGFPPQPQQMRAKKIGRVIVDTATDRPWSQYFCCMVAANREFINRYPIATKRAVRAILKAADVCARDPERAAKYLVANGYERRYDVALEVLKGLPYDRWRQTDPEDTVRFHALRLHEVGMIKSSPQKLIAQGTDWRLLGELKKELKA